MENKMSFITELKKHPVDTFYFRFDVALSLDTISNLITNVSYMINLSGYVSWLISESLMQNDGINLCTY